MDSFTHGPLRFDLTDAGSGPPVVLLHGFPQDSRCWDTVTPLLVSAGLRTLRFDQRGYAPGARPRPTSAYAVGRLVEDVLALLDAAALHRAHLVGHDLGALVAWSLAGRHPDRVSSLTVLSVPHPSAFLRSFVSSTQALHSWYMAVFQPPGLAEQLLGRPRIVRRLLATTDAPASVVDRALELTADPDRRRAMMQWYRALPLSMGEADRRPCPVPTTFAWSTGDTALSRRGAELTADHVTGPYRFEVLDGVTHWIPEQAPEAVADLVLDRVLHGR